MTLYDSLLCKLTKLLQTNFALTEAVSLLEDSWPALYHLPLCLLHTVHFHPSLLRGLDKGKWPDGKSILNLWENQQQEGDSWEGTSEKVQRLMGGGEENPALVSIITHTDPAGCLTWGWRSSTDVTPPWAASRLPWSRLPGLPRWGAVRTAWWWRCSRGGPASSPSARRTCWTWSLTLPAPAAVTPGLPVWGPLTASNTNRWELWETQRTVN